MRSPSLFFSLSKLYGSTSLLFSPRQGREGRENGKNFHYLVYPPKSFGAGVYVPAPPKIRALTMTRTITKAKMTITTPMMALVKVFLALSVCSSLP